MAEIQFELKKKKKCSRIKKSLEKCMLAGNIETHYLLICSETTGKCRVESTCILKLVESKKDKINNLWKYIQEEFECSTANIKYNHF
jgi:hypothetical protein